MRELAHLIIIRIIAVIPGNNMGDVFFYFKTPEEVLARHQTNVGQKNFNLSLNEREVCYFLSAPNKNILLGQEIY